MKAKGRAHEWTSESRAKASLTRSSRVRENRLHGLMRGRKPKRTQPSACLRSRFPPALPVLCPPSFDGKKMEMSATLVQAEAERAAGGVAPLSKAVRQMAIFAVLPATSGTAARIAAGRTGLETGAPPPPSPRFQFTPPGFRAAHWRAQLQPSHQVPGRERRSRHSRHGFGRTLSGARHRAFGGICSPEIAGERGLQSTS